MARDHRDDYWALLGPGCDRTSEWVMLYCLRRPCGVSDRPSAPLNSTCLSMLCAAYLRLMAKVTSPLPSLLARFSRTNFTKKHSSSRATKEGTRSMPEFPLLFRLSFLVDRGSSSTFAISWRSFRAFDAEPAHLPWITSVNFGRISLVDEFLGVFFFFCFFFFVFGSRSERECVHKRLGTFRGF